ncbi:DUF4232 domain-containing protein [Actinomycetes bacterium M1A6_2h]
MSVSRLSLTLSILAVAATTVACASEGSSPVPAPAASSTDTAATSSAVPTPGAVQSASTVQSTVVSTTTDTASDTSCLFGELSVALGGSDAGPTSTILTVNFTNTGARECTIVGFPGVSEVGDQGGPQIGKSAVRDPDEPPTVGLSPGDTTSSRVYLTYATAFPDYACGPSVISGLKVIPPNTFDSVYLAFPSSGCTRTDTDVEHLRVGPVGLP